MKNRIFYVIHLDMERILIIIFLFFLFIFGSFFIGIKVGKNSKMNTDIVLESPIPKEPKEQEVKIQESVSMIEQDQESQKKSNTIPLKELKKSENSKIFQLEVEDKKFEEDKVHEQKISNKEKSYVIQIGAYKNKEEANQVSSKLKKNGIESYLQKKNKLYVIYVKANSTEELDITKKELQKLNLKDIIVYKNK